MVFTFSLSFSLRSLVDFKKPHRSLQKFNVKNVCQHGISNLSDLLTVSVSYILGDSDDEKKLNMVVKLLPHDAFGRYFVTMNQFDLREIQFYTKVS